MFYIEVLHQSTRSFRRSKNLDRENAAFLVLGWFFPKQLHRKADKLDTGFGGPVQSRPFFEKMLLTSRPH